MPIAEMVSGSEQVERAAVRGAMAHDHDRLGGGAHADQGAVFGDEHVRAAHHGAPGQKDAERAAQRVHGVEAALLTHVPVQFDVRGAAQQDRGETFTSGQELADVEHGAVAAEVGGQPLVCQPPPGDVVRPRARRRSRGGGVDLRRPMVGPARHTPCSG